MLGCLGGTTSFVSDGLLDCSEGMGESGEGSIGLPDSSEPEDWLGLISVFCMSEEGGLGGGGRYSEIGRFRFLPTSLG